MKRIFALLAAAVILMLLAGCFEVTLFDYQISGIVRQSGLGTPIAGVMVTASVTGKAGTYQDITDASGGYSITLNDLRAPSQINIYFSKEGYVPDSETIVRSSDGTYTLNVLLVLSVTGDGYVRGSASLMNLPPPATSIPSSIRIGSKAPKPPVVPETTEVLLHPKAGVRPERINSFLSSKQTSVKRSSFESGYLLVPIPEGMDIEDFIDSIMAEGIAERVEPNDWAVINAFFEPNDDYFLTAQWNMFATTAPYAWDMPDFGSAAVVAVLDTGVDVFHPDLAGRTLTPIDTIHVDSGTKDVYGHGTHVAGIIAAVMNNGQYMAGISKDTLILPVKVLADGGSGTVASIMDGIRAATAANVDVISMSLGYSDGLIRTDIATAIDEALAAGIVVVAAAGNQGSLSVNFPGNYPGVITVSAINPSFESSNFTNYGPEVEFAAPGGEIIGTVTPNPGVWSLYPTDKGYVEEMAGTSQATPHVSGLIAMLLQQGYTASQAIDMIGNTSQDNHRGPSYEYYYGQGIINAHAALNALTMDKAFFWLAEPVFPYTMVPGTFVFGSIDKTFSIPFDLPAGDYYLAGWMDTNGNGGVPDDGDYYKAQLATFGTGGMNLIDVFTLDLVSTSAPSSVKSGFMFPEKSFPIVR